MKLTIKVFGAVLKQSKDKPLLEAGIKRVAKQETKQQAFNDYFQGRNTEKINFAKALSCPDSNRLFVGVNCFLIPNEAVIGYVLPDEAGNYPQLKSHYHIGLKIIEVIDPTSILPVDQLNHLNSMWEDLSPVLNKISPGVELPEASVITVQLKYGLISI